MQWLKVNRLDTQQANFEAQLSQLLGWESVSDQRVQKTVADIIERVKLQGDTALLQLTNQLDRTPFKTASELEIPQQKLDQALADISHQERDALQTAAARIRAYHQHQRQDSWSYVEADGTLLGQQITAMDRVGIYVPGGKASYPSSVLMNAIPAKVAGVKEIIMTVPLPNGKVNPLVLAAAAIAGVDRVFAIGGAQAIAALAYGTPMVPKVDKIVGPGNIYVATAKRAVFGACGIDMIAGPSEILIICDGHTDPDWVAMDLFSQAEHDEQAQSILLCPDKDYLDQVEASFKALLPTLERSSIIKTSIENRGALIQVANMQEAIDITNRIAPEHLELSVADPEAMLPEIRHAGAIFMGRHTAESLGDYCAGPNHVLPTSGTARFSSPLGVYDFQKRSSLIMFSEQGASEMGKVASVLARGESLTAHARSAEYRILD
ncbi:MAG: histidinol dehydrogenase [Gammaproteobacteria bacterium]|jgi:histidinol dehydrogenase|nr:MAG: Histidinol dehydrogenase [Oceanospirillaceae bacterium UBA2001]|tara:strand:- start:720 stop:2027 length:1308 start_codon:yes stop_codon:yes gene_type:complete